MSSTDVCDLGHAMTCNKTGVKVEKGQRFGFHNLRHSLASFLVTKKTDVKPAQYASCQEHNHARPLHANRHGRADRGAGAGARMAHFLSCRYHVCSVVFCTAFLSSSMDALKETGDAAALHNWRYRPESRPSVWRARSRILLDGRDRASRAASQRPLGADIVALKGCGGRRA